MRDLSASGHKKQHTSTYKASTNGQLERLHRTVNGMMGRVVTDWDLWVPCIMAAYRSTRQESSQYSPNYLMFNRETRCGVDLLYDTMPVADGQSSTYDQYVEEMTDRRRAAYQLVRQHLGEAA